MPETLRRAQLNRLIRRNLTASTAAEAIGPITHGCEIFGISKGQFSLIDIIGHCLDATGPSSVTISTWTAAGADLGFANKLLTDGRITAIRFVVDFSFPTRQPAYCAALRERFGDSSIRVTKTHAKFITISNAEWSIAIRSSMNLNENRRLESFEISEHRPMVEYLDSLINDLFAHQAEGQAFKQGAYATTVDFEKFKESPSTSGDSMQPAPSTDTAKYFGDGRYSADLRRSGLTNAGAINARTEPQAEPRKRREYRSA